jgi:hypothetical protein
MRKVTYTTGLDKNKIYVATEDEGTVGYYYFKQGTSQFFDIWGYSYITDNPSKHSINGGRDENNLTMHINNNYITDVFECILEELDKVVLIKKLMS